MSNERTCQECGKPVEYGMAVVTNFGVFHEHCYGSESLKKYGAHLSSVHIGLERALVIGREKP